MGEGRCETVTQPLGLSVLLLDDERSDVVPGLVVVFGVGPVTVRELQAQLHNVRGAKTQSLLSNHLLHYSYETQSVCDT